jgi:hypothetical protein
MKSSRKSITYYLPLHYSGFEPRLQRGLSIRSSVLLAAMQLEAVSNMLA